MRHDGAVTLGVAHEALAQAGEAMLTWHTVMPGFDLHSARSFGWTLRALVQVFRATGDRRVDGQTVLARLVRIIEAIGCRTAYLAPFEAASDGTLLQGDAGFILDAENLFEVLGYTRADLYAGRRGVFQRFIRSFSTLNDRRALAVRPRTVSLYEVRRDTTLGAALEHAGVGVAEIAAVALLNNGRVDDPVRAGTLIKVVRETADAGSGGRGDLRALQVEDRGNHEQRD